MFELISVPPIVQGLLVVLTITVLAVGLYVGYAVVERFLENRLRKALDTI